jgi:hypothetical protein
MKDIFSKVKKKIGLRDLLAFTKKCADGIRQAIIFLYICMYYIIEDNLFVRLAVMMIKKKTLFCKKGKKEEVCLSHGQYRAIHVDFI